MTDAMVSARSGKYGVKTFARDALILLLGVGLFFVAMGTSLHFGLAANGSPVEKRGVAVARECVPAGLFGPRSWGWWETCHADIRWTDGTVEQAQFDQSRLTSADIGRQVEVVQRRVDQGAGKSSHESLFRAGFEPMMVGSVLYYPLLIVGSLMVLLTVYRWVNVVRGWFGLAPWGSRGDEK